MEQKEKKGFKFYFNIIKIPGLILLVWMMLSATIGTNKHLQMNPLFIIINWAGIVVIFGIIGFMVTRKVNDREGTIGIMAGLLAGALCGIIAAIITAVLYLSVPGFITSIVDTQYGIMEEIGQVVSREQLESLIKVGMITSIIINPVINGVIGLVISGISALIFRRK